MLLTASPSNSTLGSPTPATGGTLPGGFSPQQITQAYGFNQITFNNGTVVGDGSGQTIAIVDAYDQPNLASDLANFDSTFGLAAPPSFTKVNETGGTSLPGVASASWSLEESLDVEWAHAIAPGANILLVEASSNSWSDLFTAVNYARQQPGVAAVSMSWYGGEWSGESTYNSYFQTPTGHSGVTFVACTGDNGSSGANEPGFPSVSANTLAVGGTQLSTDSSGNYLSETGWSGSGGGLSAYQSQPSYQKGTVTQSSTQRAIPDVSYNGSTASPFAVYDTSSYGGWIQVYGTSAGAPQWAALVAIADQGRALAGLSALDGATQTLPALYQLPASDFHDITSGSNGAYSAGPGYDLVTGRGSPIANLVVSGLVNYGVTQSGPTITTAASANPSPVTGRTTNLSAGATDPAGASSLIYTWSASSVPSGAAAPTFSVNGTNAAQNTVATFSKAGTYTLKVTVTDPSNLTATSSVNVTVNQTLTSITLSPGTVSLADGKTQQFTATGLDQFGQALASQPAFTWAVTSGGGSVSSSGLYSTPSSGSGTANVVASSGGISSSAATVTYQALSGPSITAAASANASPVSGTTANLSVQASDASAPSGLVYSWVATSSPTGAPAPTFSVNNSTSAASTTVTFYRAGNYTFQVTVTDQYNLTTTSTVNVTVAQTLTSVSLTPSTASVADGNTQQFTATALDQFGQSLTTQPSSWVWSVMAGLGSVSGNGLYSAPSSGNGQATLQASSGGMSNSASVSYTGTPAAPTNLTATSVTSHQIILTWTDNGGNESGFIIQRSTNGSSWTQIGSVGPGVTSFTDNTVSKRKTYWYRVYAYNSAGNSGDSNVVQVTTPAAGVGGGAGLAIQTPATKSGPAASSSSVFESPWLIQTPSGAPLSDMAQLVSTTPHSATANNQGSSLTTYHRWTSVNPWVWWFSDLFVESAS